MKSKLFGNNIEPSCSYCTFGRRTANDKILCQKKGIVDLYFSCKKFDYDPLKRDPKKPNIQNDFTKKDFEL